MDHRDAGPVAEADLVEDHRRRRVARRGFARLFAHGEFGFVERGLQAPGGQHAAANTAQPVADAEQPGAECGAQQQERQQVHRVHPARDDQQGAD